MKEAGFHSSLHPGMFPLRPLRPHRGYMEQDKSSPLSVLLHYYDLKRHWICGGERMGYFSPPHMHADAFMRTTAAALFLSQSLTLLAGGTSNHNCKLIICPRRWLRHRSHPRLNTSLSSVIAAIVVRSATKEQQRKNLERPAGLKSENVSL